MAKELWIMFETRSEFETKEDILLNVFERNMGNSPVIVYVKEINGIKRLTADYNVDISKKLIIELEDIVDSSSIKVVEKEDLYEDLLQELREAPGKIQGLVLMGYKRLDKLIDCCERIADSLEALTECTYKVKPMYENSEKHRVFSIGGTVETIRTN